MTPVQEITFCLMTNPSQFSDPIDVCNYLFLTSGNQYEWYDGELKLLGPDIEFNLDEILKLSNKLLADKWEAFGDLYNETIYRRLEQQIIDADSIAKIDISHFSTPYKIVQNLQLCNINNIPENITDEWLSLVEKVVRGIDNHLNLAIESFEYDKDFIGKMMSEMAKVKNRITDVKAMKNRCSSGEQRFFENVEKEKNLPSYIQ